MAWFDGDRVADGELVADRGGVDRVPGADLLQFWVDAGGGVGAFGVVHGPGEDEPFDLVVAVEPGPVGPDLGQPGPDRLGRGLDGDRPGVVGRALRTGSGVSSARLARPCAEPTCDGGRVPEPAAGCGHGISVLAPGVGDQLPGAGGRRGPPGL